MKSTVRLFQYLWASPFMRMSHSKRMLGAHVSIQGGLHNAIHQAEAIQATAIAFFVGSQRQWKRPESSPDDITRFREALAASGFDPWSIVPHGSYLINCGAPDPEVLEKSRHLLLHEMKTCEKLGLPMYNVHPGSSVGKISTKECIERIAETINDAHDKTENIVLLIENMSRQGNTVGGEFKELQEIIQLVKNKSRIGICFDTCHALAAGYDLSTEEGLQETVKAFGEIEGFKYLRAIHLNDSKGAAGCRTDRHENIAKGHIGVEGFRRFLNNENFKHFPMILETPLKNKKDPVAEYSKELEYVRALCE